MKPKRMSIKTVGIILWVFAAMLPSSESMASVQDFGYRTKDEAAEKKKYIRKLTDDKKKVELAIQNTKRLIDRSRNKPYLPELYLRLAELYVEQSRLSFFMRKSERQGEKSAFDQLESNTLKNQAIEVYQRILDNFPQYEARDKVHFFMAHEFRELGKLDEMIRHYRAIIKQYPQSLYVSESYLLLGDHFINLQDLDTAKKHYVAVLNYPESPAIAIARYKLAWCHINKAEFAKAIKLFEKAVQTTADNKKLDVDTYKRVDIRFESLIDMAYCYSECYKKSSPQEALVYFQKYSWSRPVYTAVLEKLAYRYYIKKKWSHAAEIYRELSVLQHDPSKLLEYARNVFECTQATGSYAKTDKDMELIVKALRKQKYSIHIADKDKEKNIADYEIYARNIVTHLHNKARTQKSVEQFKLASDSYRLYLDFFDQSPVRREMALNYAEALFSSHQYLDSGKEYEALMSRITLEGKEKEELTYGAVISYYNALKNKETLNYYQVAFAREGLKTAGRQYATTFPGSKRVPDVLFNVAWIAYDAGEYDNAITEFTRFVETYPRGAAAKAAIHLILDAYNLKEDYEGLIHFGKKMIAMGAIKDQKLKTEIAQIVNATESKIISSLTLAAMDDWEKGKTGLQKYAEKENATGMGEQALYALMISSKEKGDLESLLFAGKDMVRQYPKSTKIEDTLGMMIDATIRTAQFRMVADNLEEFTQILPAHANTADFLFQAGQIRERLGQYEKSNRDFRQVLHKKNRNGIRREDLVFGMADNAMRANDTRAAIRILADNQRLLSATGRVRAHAIIADLYLKGGERKSALTYRKKAYKGYKPQMGKNNPEVKNAMAKMVYHAVHRSNRKYMALRMENSIDNSVVASKTKLLTQLEKGYLSVIKYQSPVWALTACYRASEINREFGRFLKASPLPDLSPEQKEQYVALIDSKAQAYLEKADQYQTTCIQQAHKWEVCDPGLMAFYLLASGERGPRTGQITFSGSTSPIEIGEQCLQDRVLKGMHERLLKTPDNYDILLELAQAYIQKGDYRHAQLIAEKALGEMKIGDKPLRASFQNSLGIAYLYSGDDIQAREAFKKALVIDADHIGAKMNLAALFKYYGHVKKANRIYGSLPSASATAVAEGLIHPRAREYYNAHNQLAKK